MRRQTKLRGTLAALGLVLAACNLATSADKAADAGRPPESGGNLVLQGTVYQVVFGPGIGDSTRTLAANATVEIRLVGVVGPDTIPGDSLPTPPDSMVIPPDSGVQPWPDTLLTAGRPWRLDSIPVDSLPVDSIPPDSIGVPPDTLPGWACGSRGAVVATVHTDAQGHYEASGLAAGLYDLHATPAVGNGGFACGMTVRQNTTVDLYTSR